MGTMDAIEFINSKLKDTKNNAELWWSPFDFQDLKLSPNDLKYPFFLLPHFFFAKTKNGTLKGQSRQAKCNTINKMSRSWSSPNVVVAAFIVVAPLSLPPSSVLSVLSVPCCLVSMFSMYLCSGSSSPPFALTPPYDFH